MNWKNLKLNPPTESGIIVVADLKDNKLRLSDTWLCLYDSKTETVMPKHLKHSSRLASALPSSYHYIHLNEIKK